MALHDHVPVRCDPGQQLFLGIEALHQKRPAPVHEALGELFVQRV